LGKFSRLLLLLLWLQFVPAQSDWQQLVVAQTALLLLWLLLLLLPAVTTELREALSGMQVMSSCNCLPAATIVLWLKPVPSAAAAVTAGCAASRLV
jgi:hypothetical protein